MAIQIFYQFEFFEEKIELSHIAKDVVENYLLKQDEDVSSYEKNINKDFLSNLIEGLKNNTKNIDKNIEELLKSPWNLEAIDEVTLQIIRFGCFELTYAKTTPAKVIIDEYVDIASSFFDDKKVTFVNAILDKLAKQLRNDEFNQTNA